MNRLEFELFDELRGTVAPRPTGSCTPPVPWRPGRARGARPRCARARLRPPGCGRRGCLEIRTDAIRSSSSDRWRGVRAERPRLDVGEVECLVITGPNMAGKSTFMRQVALIVLMAQVGASCRPGARDRRGGPHLHAHRRPGQPRARPEHVHGRDDGDRGHPAHATPRSLVLLDEIGRGTSTFDGLAIAWAVVEYLHDRRRRARSALRHALPRADAAGRRAAAACVTCTSPPRGRADIVFLHRVVPGGTDRSYGIQVARLAGLPDEVVARAQALLRELEQGAPSPAAPGERRHRPAHLFGAGRRRAREPLPPPIRSPRRPASRAGGAGRPGPRDVDAARSADHARGAAPTTRSGRVSGAPAVRRLPDALVNKIAAGEVVERPASVVKELVENSLDAGATPVSRGAGRRPPAHLRDRRRPRHDPRGLSAGPRTPRHVQAADETDLDTIDTLGFRGEALPAIFAVSRLSLLSRPLGGDTGVPRRRGRVVSWESRARPTRPRVRPSRSAISSSTRRPAPSSSRVPPPSRRPSCAVVTQLAPGSPGCSRAARRERAHHSSTPSRAPDFRERVRRDCMASGWRRGSSTLGGEGGGRA